MLDANAFKALIQAAVAENLRSSVRSPSAKAQVAKASEASRPSR